MSGIGRIGPARLLAVTVVMTMAGVANGAARRLVVLAQVLRKRAAGLFGAGALVEKLEREARRPSLEQSRLICGALAAEVALHDPLSATILLAASHQNELGEIAVSVLQARKAAALGLPPQLDNLVVRFSAMLDDPRNDGAPARETSAAGPSAARAGGAPPTSDDTAPADEAQPETTVSSVVVDCRGPVPDEVVVGGGAS